VQGKRDVRLSAASIIDVAPRVSDRWIRTLGVLTALASLVVTALVLASAARVDDLAIAGHIPLAWTALAVLTTVFLLGLLTRSLDLRLSRRFPLVVVILSLVVSLGTWALLALGNESLAASIYRGLHIPQGVMQFWDLSLVMLSVDCARWGFDIYQDNNGCMQDPSIYAPGMVWLARVPFDVFSQNTAPALGVVLIVASSLALGWLASQSSGVGQVLLAIAAVGAPWVLLMERGNIDAVVFVVLVVGVLLTRRYRTSLAVWLVVAGLFWLMGTWKYYPFVMGIALLPVLSIRRGWIVIAGYVTAAMLYVIATWENLLFSSSTNAGMVDFGDWAVLGRVPLVARMIDATPGGDGLQAMDVPVILMTLLAVAWGVAVGQRISRRGKSAAALAAGGAALYLSSVFLSGFGYGYKAVFLLAGVPLATAVLARGSRSGLRPLVGTGLVIVLLLGVQSVIMWNTVLATQAGLIAAGFLFGCGSTVMLRSIWVKRRDLSGSGARL
jgi:hypothetical protein